MTKLKNSNCEREKTSTQFGDQTQKPKLQINSKTQIVKRKKKCDNLKIQNMIKLKNLNSVQTQKLDLGLKLWQNSKPWIATSLNNSSCDKTHNSSCDNNFQL